MFKSFWTQRFPTHHKHAGNEVFESTQTSVGDLLNRISDRKAETMITGEFGYVEKPEFLNIEEKAIEIGKMLGAPIAYRPSPITYYLRKAHP